MWILVPVIFLLKICIRATSVLQLPAGHFLAPGAEFFISYLKHHLLDPKPPKPQTIAERVAENEGYTLRAGP